MKIWKTLLCFSLLFVQQLQAQPVEMADTMREDGKIYVVVGVLAVIFAGFVIVLALMDQRLRRLEKKNRNEGTQS